MKALFLFVLFVVGLVYSDVIEFSGYLFSDVYENKVTNSGFALQKDLPAKTSLVLDVELDQVSQPPIAAGQTRTIDGITGASRPSRLDWETSGTRQLNRGQFILGLSKLFGQNTTLGVNLYTSQEIDYDSKAVSANIQQELFQKNLTINLSGQYSLDSVGALNSTGLSYEKKESQRGDISVQQLLSPTSYFSAGFYSEIQKGFLSNPYRIYFADANTGVTLFEAHPNYRFRYSGWLRLAKMFPSTRSSINVLYRQYRDDWEMLSHTVQLNLNQYITSHFFLGATMRHYRQGGAYFYGAATTEAYYSLDEKLRASQANNFGLGATWFLKGLAQTFQDLSFLKDASLYLGYLRYFNDVTPTAYASNLWEYKLRFEF